MMAAPGLGVRLRQSREVAEYSQQEIADLLGVVRETVSYWENDRRLPSAIQLARLAEAYGVTTGSLLGTEPPPVASEEHELVYRGLLQGGFFVGRQAVQARLQYGSQSGRHAQILQPVWIDSPDMPQPVFQDHAVVNQHFDQFFDVERIALGALVNGARQPGER